MQPVSITFVPIPKFSLKGDVRESVAVLWHRVPRKGDRIDFSETAAVELHAVKTPAGKTVKTPADKYKHIYGEVYEVCWFSAHEVQVTVKVIPRLPASTRISPPR